MVTKSSEVVKSLLADYPVVIDWNVQWAEMDALQHVNNINFFRYFENARIEYYSRTGMLDNMKTTNVGPILKSTSCDYKRPLTFPDCAKVGVRVRKITKHSIVCSYRVVSTAQAEVVAEGNSTAVMYDYNNNYKTPVPESVRAQLERIEGRTL